MSTQRQSDFEKIEKAIKYITENFIIQPNLDTIAKKVNLSPSHFQKMFTQWAGTSPKKFLQYITIEHAKKLLKEEKISTVKTAIKSGLSGTGRLHDLFVTIEGMTPGEYKHGGKNLTINYSFSMSPFGEILIGSTKKGMCYMAFDSDKTNALTCLKKLFPQAQFRQKKDDIQKKALLIFTNHRNKSPHIQLHVKGSEFQLKVWEMLLKIPEGSLSTYGTVAIHIGHPKAHRAVGTAVGKNPVAFIIPCHRVIQSSGIFGNYHWGNAKKAAMIGWESAQRYDKPIQ